MAECIRMPKMSDTMQQGTISRWIKQVGDKVAAGDILAEVETDKATMELESYEDGTLLYIAEKSVAPVNAIIAIIGESGEDISALLAATVSTATVAGLVPSSDPVVACPVAPPVGDVLLPSDRLLASPLAKKLAQEKGYDLTQIQGSGSAGRVVKKDIVQFVPDHSGSAWMEGHSTQPAYQDLPVSAMRQTIAKVLTESKSHIPHFYLTLRIHMDPVMALRAELNHHPATKISINDLIIKATALALVQHPKVNAAWFTYKIRTYSHAHIGVAIAVEEGLLVPVVRFADQKPLVAISKEVKLFSKQAQDKKLAVKDTTGATFTISNLGMLGIESFSAIINPPAACILAVGAVQQLPIVQDHQVVPAHMLQVTLSCDHRVVDGAVGALFLSTLKSLLEKPLALLL
ncbi:pyruvate dehydrogenase complex dihydrolipoamide acetyltransferase [Cardinium endosymbiont of Sogatella furcifera]|uniref:dihydrolipoamide acetyltransferase family protein n=1 Tax=Cardinium endosymbiont of Sogatella furcifera TaxID=650378 RepID=UPI000E0DBD57|nr:dihydrolipoamide acetyltransferase family protein [Cardinium endosymbiont of Sogatella furcifera]AXI24383.1 pyruvate dehydrogenase complex dihydrolipoamide acetyltransferase [Cardinium endosymbiont of Sogatella furcifera]